MDSAELERSADRALRRLPMPRAPRTLLPRVLAAAAALVQRPWYARTWHTWPLPLRLGAMTAATLLIGLTFVFSHQAEQATAIVSGYMRAATAHLPELIQAASGIAIAVQSLWRGLLQPIAIIGFVLVVLMLLAGGLCWTIIDRLTPATETA